MQVSLAALSIRNILEFLISGMSKGQNIAIKRFRQSFGDS